MIESSFHSWIPRIPSVCACQEAEGLKEWVEMIVTCPDESPEYSRLLSVENDKMFI